MKPMTIEEFELARVAHGTDMANWPTDVADRARLFLKTDEGAAFAASELALDARLAAFADPPGTQARADVFLGRLLDVPVQHMPVQQANSGFLSALAGLYQDFRTLFSPLGLASQGVAYALVLVVGVFVGLQQPYDEESSVDLSSTLFSSSADFYLEDQ
ncbi:hypothetical protein [Kordiimonas lacus]|uniref:Uncharacterized protein n=1 Tax=Kordiimonas lacus TaxID=637679 RepID=A0A1G6TQV9_9PROT|nr:hypothetical protein [Kordiimonas lacus]SDD31493.1 hypothetical protein SAMN04488071_0324 [Kordiimonas lacus]